MATIALYASKVNQMPELVQGIKSAVNDYKTELQILQIKALSVGVSVFDLNDVISSIQSSTQTQEEKVSSFDTFEQNTEEFIETSASVDNDVADVINQQRAEFYEEYAYLQPECEKNAWDKFFDKCKSVGEWCKEYWVEIFVTITLVVDAVFAISTVFWTGMFTNGKEHVPKNYIKHYGGSSLETILQEQGVLGKGFNSQMFDWKGASSSLAMNSVLSGTGSLFEAIMSLSYASNTFISEVD